MSSNTPIPRGGGGSSISDPLIAYIRIDGNNATGQIGNPAKPYLTGQAAYNAGAKYFDIGADCDAGTVTTTQNEEFYVIGRGDDSRIYFIAPQHNLTVWDTGGISCWLDLGTFNAGDASSPSGNLVVHGGYINTAVTSGVNANASPAVDGSSAGSLTIYGPALLATSVNAVGGNAFDDGGTPHNGGNGGAITVQGSVIGLPGFNTLSYAKGTGINGGTDGADGSLTLRGGPIVPTPTPDAATVAGAVINGVFYANAYP